MRSKSNKGAEPISLILSKLWTGKLKSPLFGNLLEGGTEERLTSSDAQKQTEKQCFQ